MKRSGPRCCAFLHSSQLVGRCFRLSSSVFSFLVGSARAWKDRFLNDVTVSILYFITPSARFRASRKLRWCRGRASARFSFAVSAPFAFSKGRQKAQKL